ncbi:hypothetical protein GF322_00455 [Candidatus Dependentiae bacterium]|nr:hypothetical protein [Candidatus Dependentiae bacterium]
MDEFFNWCEVKDQYSGPVQTPFTSFLFDQDPGPFWSKSSAQQPSIITDDDEPSTTTTSSTSTARPTTTTTTSSTTRTESFAPESGGLEGRIITGRDGTQIRIDLLQRFTNKTKEYTDKLRYQIEHNPEQRHACLLCDMVDGISQMVESLIERHKQIASQTPEQEMLEYAAIMSKIGRYMIRGTQRISNGIGKSIKDFNPINNLKLIVSLLENASPEPFPFYWAGDPRGRAAAEQLFQHSIEQQKKLDATIDRIKQMSWGDLLESGAYLGCDCLLNGLSLFALKKLHGITGKKFVNGLKKFAEAGKAEESVAATSKGLSVANELNKDATIAMKLVSEYGAEDAINMISAIQKNAKVLEQNESLAEIVKKCVYFSTEMKSGQKNFTFSIKVTKEEAQMLGEGWLGKGFTLTGNNNGFCKEIKTPDYIIQRTYRFPSLKKCKFHSGEIVANFEERIRLNEKLPWEELKNGHLIIKN